MKKVPEKFNLMLPQIDLGIGISSGYSYEQFAINSLIDCVAELQEEIEILKGQKSESHTHHIKNLDNEAIKDSKITNQSHTEQEDWDSLITHCRFIASKSEKGNYWIVTDFHPTFFNKEEAEKYANFLNKAKKYYNDKWISQAKAGGLTREEIEMLIEWGKYIYSLPVSNCRPSAPLNIQNKLESMLDQKEDK